MAKIVTYKKQGDGSDSWLVEENGEKIMVYDISETFDWKNLRKSLFISTPFQRALQNPQLVNNVAYGALQTILSTEGNDLYLKAMLSNLMTFTIEEKAELNKILADNNFTISL